MYLVYYQPTMCPSFRNFECLTKRQNISTLFFHFQDGDNSVRESDHAWPSMVGDAAIKRRYSQQHSVPSQCSPSHVDRLTQEILENHSSEESSMDKKNLRDSREILARPQYDDTDTAIIINGIKHEK